MTPHAQAQVIGYAAILPVLASHWFTGDKRRWSWLLKIGIHGAFLYANIILHFWGFAAMSVFAGLVCLRGWLKWK